MNTENRHFLRRAFAAAMALLMLLGCAGCGGKEENMANTSASGTVTTETAGSETAEAVAEEEEFVYEVYKAPGEVSVLTEEEHQAVVNGCKAIEEPYLVNGSVPIEKVSEVLDLEWEYAKSVVQAGKAVKCANSPTGFSMKFAEGTLFAYCVKIEGFLSGGGKNRITVIMPAEEEILKETYFNPPGFAKAGEKLNNAGIGYDLSTADILRDEEADLYSVVKAIEGASVILWQGHGGDEGDIDETGEKACYFVLAGDFSELKKDPEFAEDCYMNNSIIEFTDGIAITPEFIPRHFSSESFPNALVYLASCHSADNSRFADAFISCGAQVVIGYKGLSYYNNACKMCNAYMECMIEGMTAGDALVEAESNPLNYTTGDVIDTLVTNVKGLFNEEYMKYPVFFGNPNFILSNTFLYYADGEHKYSFDGTVSKIDGKYWLVMDEKATARSLKKNIPFSKILIDDKYSEICEKLLEKKHTLKGAIIYGQELIAFYGDMELAEQSEEVPENQSSDEASAKTYDNLFDFLGESLDVVKQYYGEPNSDMGFDGNADCLTYEYGNYQVQFRSYGEKGVAEIDLRLEETSPEVKVTSSVTTKMNHDEIWAGLPEFSCSTEANDYDNGEGMVHSTWLYGDSAKGNVSFHWSSTGFNKNDLTKGPCCVFLCKYQ